VINACALVNENWEAHGLNSDVAVAFNLEKKVAVIFGTWYGGENKKGIFGLMNYLLPLKGIMPMHCSANVGKDGDTCLFFGLSGTGKTTLSADPRARGVPGETAVLFGDARARRLSAQEPRAHRRRRARLGRRRHLHRAQPEGQVDREERGL